MAINTGFNLRSLTTLVLVCVLSAFPTVGFSNEIVAVDFTNKGTFQTSRWQSAALEITSSADLSFLEYNGLGVVGQTDDAVDPRESITFSFLSPAYYLRLSTGAIGNLNGIQFNTAKITAFGVNGVALGSVAGVEPMPSVFVNSLFGNAPISSFTIQATEDVYRFSAIQYSLAVPEPEPAIALLVGLGTIALVVRRKAQ